MLFSLNYKSPLKQQADEIKCPINQLGLIFQFIKDNLDKRYNITISDSKNIDYNKIIEQIEFVKNITNDYTVECGSAPLLFSLIDVGYNAYLRFPVQDWETFSNLKAAKVSDIYIDGPLGFQCDTLEKAHDGVKIRVSPTVSANAALNTGSNATSFFIRPEDLYLYDEVIDMIDFKIDNDQEKEKALYEIYRRGTFNFDLNDLIEHLNISTPNSFIRREFGQNRLNCGMRCRSPASHCHFCQTTLTLANTTSDYLKRIN